MPTVTGIAHANAERLRRHAHRAVDNPVELAKAARIVRAAIARGKLDPAVDLDPLPAPGSPASTPDEAA